MVAPTTGLFKSVALKAQAAFGTVATTGSAQYLRRVTSTLDLAKAGFMSQEINSDAQYRDFRHGQRSISGEITGELSPLTYQALMTATLRAASFTAGVNSTALTNVTAAAGPPGTFTRAAGSFLTDGFKVNDVVRWSGWATGGSTANNARNYRITALTATVMTVGNATTGAAGQSEAVIAQASGDTVTCTVVGKKLITPASSLADTCFSIEHWFSDISKSELFVDCKPSGLTIAAPAGDMARITFPIMGRSATYNTSQYFVTPTAVTTQRLLAGVNGKISIGGTDYATITGININVAGGHSTEAVVGSDLTPGIFPGMLNISGSLTALFDTTTLRDALDTEAETSIALVLVTTQAINADFINVVIPRIKLSANNKDDKPGAITQSLNFQALLNTAGGSGTSGDATTMMIQDSQAA